MKFWQWNQMWIKKINSLNTEKNLICKDHSRHPADMVLSNFLLWFYSFCANLKYHQNTCSYFILNCFFQQIVDGMVDVGKLLQGIGKSISCNRCITASSLVFQHTGSLRTHAPDFSLLHICYLGHPAMLLSREKDEALHHASNNGC